MVTAASSKKLRDLIDALPPELAAQALTHSSWVEERADSYGRLAFLGDSVLGLAVSSDIYPRFARQTAGRLTKIRAQAVSGRACAVVAVELGLPERMRGIAPEEGGHSAETLLATERVLASIVEAVIGACYLTYGYERTAEAVVEAFAAQVEFASEHLVDFKSTLQERLARGGDGVSYRVVSEKGPPHARRFAVAAEVNGRVVGEGAGRSKKEAEQAAAQQALKTVK